MTRLRFIKDWGPYKAGNILVTESPTTVMWLVDRYGFAVIDPLPEPDNPVATAEPQEPDADYTVPKFLRAPARDKAVKSPRKAKRETPHHGQGE